MKRSMKTSSRPPSHRAVAVSTAPRAVLGAAAHNAGPLAPFGAKDGKHATSFSESLNSSGMDVSFSDENGTKPRTPSRGRSYASVAAISPARAASRVRTPSPAQLRAAPRTPTSASRRNSARGTGTPIRTPIRTPSRRSSSIRAAASEALAAPPVIVPAVPAAAEDAAIVAPVAILPSPTVATTEALSSEQAAPVTAESTTGTSVPATPDASVHRVGGGFVSPSLASPPECVHAAMIAQQRVREWRENNRRSAAAELASPPAGPCIAVESIVAERNTDSIPHLLPTSVAFAGVHDCGTWLAPFTAYEFNILRNDGTSLRVYARYTAFAEAYEAIVAQRPLLLDKFTFPPKRLFARSVAVIAERRAAFTVLLTKLVEAAATETEQGAYWQRWLPRNAP